MSCGNADSFDILRQLIEPLVRWHSDTCCRCRRRWPSDPADWPHWSYHLCAGRPLAGVCPDCQTPEERFDIEIWAVAGTSEFDDGQIINLPKPVDGAGDDRGHSRTA